jgi:cytoplasmic tRNA 2-thiolation protein 1
MRICQLCNCNKTALKRPKTGQLVCKECFFVVFEEEVHRTIVGSKLFKPGQRVAIGASGGKDSTVLAHVMKVLNEKYKYGLQLHLLSVDEGIHGYRDDSLETVKRNRDEYGLPLEIVSYKQLYGWTMDEIVQEIGTKNNCTFCGVFRRQALDRGALHLRVDHVVTGHNADDVAETVVLNLLRGDYARLGRCTSVMTSEGDGMPRSKPLFYSTQKEIVLYAHFKKLDFFSTECTYSTEAARGGPRALIQDLQTMDPLAGLKIIYAGMQMAACTTKKVHGTGTKPHPCQQCGHLSSQILCNACTLLQGLNKSKPVHQIASDF